MRGYKLQSFHVYLYLHFLFTVTCRYGAKLIIDDEMTGGDLLIVSHNKIPGTEINNYEDYFRKIYQNHAFILLVLFLLKSLL